MKDFPEPFEAAPAEDFEDARSREPRWARAATGLDDWEGSLLSATLEVGSLRVSGKCATRRRGNGAERRRVQIWERRRGVQPLQARRARLRRRLGRRLGGPSAWALLFRL